MGNLDSIGNHKYITEKDIVNYSRNEWIYYCQNGLSENFMEKYCNLLNWEIICQYATLSCTFMDRHNTKLLWGYISYYQTLSEEFMTKYHDKIKWKYICGRQKLSKEFKRKFQDEIITGLCEFSSYLLNDCRAREGQSSLNFVEK